MGCFGVGPLEVGVWARLVSRLVSRSEPARLGSARLGNLARQKNELGSARSWLASLSEPSPSKSEPSFEPRSNFPALFLIGDFQPGGSGFFYFFQKKTRVEKRGGEGCFY